MKNTIMLCVAPGSIMYALMSFVFWNYDVSTWSSDARYFLAFFAFAGFAYAGTLYATGAGVEGRSHD